MNSKHFRSITYFKRIDNEFRMFQSLAKISDTYSVLAGSAKLHIKV